MGNTGSYTSKATIDPTLFPFTTWKTKEINEFLLRGQQELSETFALRKVEFDFLIGIDTVNTHFIPMRTLYEIFDTDKNQAVDKLEVMYDKNIIFLKQPIVLY